ncbi:MFS transporter [Tabrizicola sp. J26]|uniref:MFS transporter n=1 Tax=Alitabrizicola rongguiensis TaxID=2909234 RepID=UPI001F1FE667|nr:MFS transporter [Tabrizicola rongguiensis]MCF1707948.1 MFS transporter [Tabrizicola rongguiensis]
MQVTPFQRFVAASGLTNLADGVATVAWGWAASLLTRDPLMISLVPIALRLPWFLFALPAGIVTDRMDRRQLILRMDVLRALAFAGAAVAMVLTVPLPLAPRSGVSEPVLFGVIMAAAFIVGIAEVFRDNAAQTMLPAMVGRSDLERANGRLWSVEMVGNSLLGPALGAFLIAAAVPLPFGANALAYGLAIVLVASVVGRFRPEGASQRNWKRELSEGWHFLRDAPLLRLLAVITGVWNLLFQMTTVALLLHAQENLGLGARGYGLVLAGGAVGGVLAGFTAEWFVRRFGPGAVARWSLFASAPAFLGMALAPGGWTLALVLGLFEYTGILWNTVSVSYRQRSIPDQLLGRVNSLYRLLAWGMMPVGLALSGVIVRFAETLMPRDTALSMPFYVAAAGGIALVLFGWRGLRTGFAAPV